MKKIALILISSLLFIKLFALDDFTANLAYEKAKSLVLKEETIAKAYKEYIVLKAKLPTSIQDLKDASLLDSGFSEFNDFSKKIIFDESNPIIKNDINNSDIKTITRFYDNYYSNNSRIYTKAPDSLDSIEVKVILSKIEKFVLNNSSTDLVTNITGLVPTDLINKYLVNTDLVVSYDSLGLKEFTYNGKDIIIHSLITDLTTSNTTIKKLLDNGFLSVGDMIYMVNGNQIVQVIYLGDNNFKQIGGGSSGTGGGFSNAILQISQYAGGYLLNGDIYTWGNNDNNINTIKTKNYLDQSTDKSQYGNISIPVRLKTNNPDTYISSPNRIRYIDFYSSSKLGTCAISEDFKLYCTMLNDIKLNTELDTESDTNNKLLLREVPFFSDVYKVVGLASDGYWYILADGIKDANENMLAGKLYKYKDNSYSEIDKENYYKDIEVSITDNRIYLLGNDGKVYSIDDLTDPIQISNNSIVSLKSNPNGVMAFDSSGKQFYTYVDSEIYNINEIQGDLQTSDAIFDGNNLKKIWINADAMIQGDLDVNDLSSDTYEYQQFLIALYGTDENPKKWIKVKYISKDAICAINDNYQLYCWGKVALNDTSFLPLLNSNGEYNDDKDYFKKIVEDGEELTNSAYELKYPTYIGGFNYDFEFK